MNDRMGTREMSERMNVDELMTEWSRGVRPEAPGADLRALVSQDEGWPVARGNEVARRRPGLLAMLALLDEHMRLHEDTVEALRERRGEAES